MDFGILFFASGGGGNEPGKYRLLLEAARRADRAGLCAVWTPERHFHPFGGLFPNPSVLGAALATVTERIQIRAGSLISPLHQTLRIAEEWSVVDNLSGGRVAVSFGSGWNADDFLFFPDRYADRQAHMYGQIETVRRLWRGEPIEQTNAYGNPLTVRLYPRPIQPELPVWVTSSGNAATFESAGGIGANLLTHLIGQDLASLAGKIDRYREAFRRSRGPAAAGRVALMLHTFVGDDPEAVRAKVWTPLRDYLRSAVSLEQLAALSGGVVSGGHRIDAQRFPAELLDELADLSCERYLADGSLLGTPDRCLRMVERAAEAGVDEIACLIDFVDDVGAVLESLDRLCELRHVWSAGTGGASAEGLLAGFVEDPET